MSRFSGVIQREYIGTANRSISLQSFVIRCFGEGMSVKVTVPVPNEEKGPAFGIIR